MTTANESRQDDGMTPRIFTWDWKEQPPMEAIFAAAADASSRGRAAVMRMVETGDDSYACVVADREVSDEEAEAVMDARLFGSEELGGEQ
jgi:hypothetical protein